MATYDPTGHALLSSEAAALDPAVLEAHADLAESLLGNGSTRLKDTAFEADYEDYNSAVLAVALQVNWQLDRGEDLGAVKSWSRGDRSKEYVEGGGMGSVSPVALSIVRSIIEFEADASDWPIAGSLR